MPPELAHRKHLEYPIPPRFRTWVQSLWGTRLYHQLRHQVLHRAG